jgi:hypothetical protein
MIDPCGEMKCEDCHIGGCPGSPDGIITSESWKDTYMEKLQESKRTGKPLSEICEADPVWMCANRLSLRSIPDSEYYMIQREKMHP